MHLRWLWLDRFCSVYQYAWSINIRKWILKFYLVGNSYINLIDAYGMFCVAVDVRVCVMKTVGKTVNARNCIPSLAVDRKCYSVFETIPMQESNMESMEGSGMKVVMMNIVWL